MKGIIKLAFPFIGFFCFLGFLLFGVILMGEDEASNASSNEVGLNVSSDVLKHRVLVEKYCKEYGILDHINIILAIMQVESGGKVSDVMQSSESLGLPPNSLDTESSIRQGCKYFSELIKGIEANGCDLNTAIQSYNFGGGFIIYVAAHGKKYSYELAEGFSKEKSGSQRVTYTNPIAIPINGGWRYNYGNQFYVKLVEPYLNSTPMKFDDETVQKIMDEALKYQGFPYVFGGSNPQTSFDCSGIVQWCYAKEGINLPRTAQMQYNVTQHLSLNEAKPGDLVFFHSTYATSDYVTHIGIYVGNNRMYHAGDPIGYADLNEAYWQAHLIGAGRVK
ncbi:DUF1175 family protein [Enterococcus faecalis]|uniref:bifunctional lytic transglycosylase/C40 family peptidase n=1 Tax=Enterococcus TaxID=1350 RepID=UPI001A97CD7F|nr:bifunctional lytic transglycosylase/C40 family peptidase [Enterococcus faecalis]MBO1126589.1 DUF1175 family protein [Enterococcus faecalis]